MALLRPHMPVLSAAQRRLWPDLRGAAPLRFVLYGGLALALRLGHRASIGFDFWSERPLDRGALAAAFRFIREGTVLQDDGEFFSVSVPLRAGPVKVSFFGGVAGGRCGRPDSSEDGVLEIASLEDLFAAKLRAVAARTQGSDYRDVAALLDAGADLARGLADARAMYGAAFRPELALKALVHFKGGDPAALARREREILIRAVAAVRDLPAARPLSSRLSAATRRHRAPA